MSTPTVPKLLLTSILTAALVCAPNPVYGEHHGRSSHGGGSSHKGGSHGGGGSRSGGGHARSSGGGGSHGGRGLFGGKSHGSGLSAAPRQRSAGSYRSSGGLGSRPKSNGSFFGSRGAGSNRTPRAASASRGLSGQRQSSWASTPRSSSSFNSTGPPLLHRRREVGPASVNPPGQARRDRHLPFPSIRIAP